MKKQKKRIRQSDLSQLAAQAKSQMLNLRSWTKDRLSALVDVINDFFNKAKNHLREEARTLKALRLCAMDIAGLEPR